MNLVVSNETLPFHPADSGGIPISALLVVALDSGEVGDTVNPLGLGHYLLYSFDGDIREIPVQISTSDLTRQRKILELLQKTSRGVVVGAGKAGKGILIGLLFIILLPAMPLALLFGPGIMGTCQGPGCH
jgi:hypothetical protein